MDTMLKLTLFLTLMAVDKAKNGIKAIFKSGDKHDANRRQRK